MEQNYQIYIQNKLKSEVAFRYGLCRMHLKYARKYLVDGSVDQFWDAMRSFVNARKLARVIRRVAKSPIFME